MTEQVYIITRLQDTFLYDTLSPGDLVYVDLGLVEINWDSQIFVLFREFETKHKLRRILNTETGIEMFVFIFWV